MTTSPDPDDALTLRTGLPDALRVLADSLPRADWEAHPNFDGLTRFWLERHLMFREVLARLRQGTEQYLDGAADPRSFGRDTGRYANFLLSQLHEHHHVEDDHYFPRLRLLDPRLARGFDILDTDHHALDGALHGLAQEAGAVLRAVETGALRDPAGALSDRLEEFERFLNRHLLDEEDLIVPVILRHGLG